MSRRILIWLPALWLMISLAQQNVYAADYKPFEVKPATMATIELLRTGGYVLYMRHGPTDTSKPDRVPRVDLNDCSTQRPLTKEGLRLSAMVGEAIRKAGIPVGEVSASPMCRTKETAEAAFGKDFQIDQYLMYSSNLTAAEKIPRIENTRRLLSTPVPAGTNRVIVAHAPNLMDVIGYFPKPEAIVVIFKPLGDHGFDYVASIMPEQWAELVR